MCLTHQQPTSLIVTQVLSMIRHDNSLPSGCSRRRPSPPGSPSPQESPLCRRTKTPSGRWWSQTRASAPSCPPTPCWPSRGRSWREAIVSCSKLSLVHTGRNHARTQRGRGRGSMATMSLFGLQSTFSFKLFLNEVVGCGQWECTARSQPVCLCVSSVSL